MSKLVRTSVTIQSGVHAQGAKRLKARSCRNFSQYVEELIKEDVGLKARAVDVSAPVPAEPVAP